MAIDGTYAVVINSPMGEQDGTLTLKTDGGVLSGTADTMLGKDNFNGGTVEGDNFQCNFSAKGPMGKMNLTLTGTVCGDAISGEVKTIIGKFAFQGNRKNP